MSQWNHLSFLVISIALFGFAASGTFFSIAAPAVERWRSRPLVAAGGPVLGLDAGRRGRPCGRYPWTTTA
ncbi:MAG: hypothetical protein MZV70_28880 [Desulfobacterales bacterium]|nr:hypothetical protein [Desulfobacterales bacterium]